MLKFEHLQKKAGPDAVDVTCQLLSGQVLKKTTLFRPDEAKAQCRQCCTGVPLRRQARSLQAGCRGDAHEAGVPRMAVHASDMEMYEAMMLKQTLRFVLADDPGAGKTITVGLVTANQSREKNFG